MIDWPQLDELKQVLDVDSEDWDGIETSGEGATRLSRLLEAAIGRVKTDVGNWDEDEDLPDATLAQAALKMAELMALRPGATEASLSKDPAYIALMVGKRRRFGIG